MKRYLLAILFITFYIGVFGQNFNDIIYATNGDIINCKITLVNDTSIFFDISVKKNKTKQGYIPISEVKEFKINTAVNDSTITATNTLYMAGQELKKFTRNYYNGLLIVVSGGFASFIGALAPSAVIGVGGVLISFVGTIIIYESHTKIGKAGDLIMEYAKTLEIPKE